MEIIEVTTQALRKEFALLPFRLYRGNPYWVPPVLKSEINNINPAVNPFFRFCDAKFWIVQKKGITVGRIGAIIHYAYIEKTQEKYGRFTRAEFTDDREVVDALFETAENWIKSKGMSGVMGPLGFSNLDTQAMLVEGFDQLASVASVYHLPYYKDHMERLGYRKKTDWIEFRLSLTAEIPEKAVRLAEIIEQRYGLSVIRMKSKRIMKKFGREIFQLLNKSFYELFSFAPLDEKMIEHVLNNYLPVINPEYVHIVTNNDQKVVGFIVPVPSLSKSMQIAKGRLCPRAMWSILRSRKKNDTVDLFLTGIDPDYQAKGVASLLITKAQEVMIKNKIRTVETTGILEDNFKAIQHWKNYEHVQNKRKRCFVKDFEQQKPEETN
ncbi:MAG: GNAT family N-acetyltransferase [Bacteroidales bacterium]|nr:GNAT family N-acetyltransferase [Bacteroidales bacterium]MDD2617748.1 GNAT family N-acetyltransferase [Bacteroidales bacterium]MDD4640775.1 GNAT family N-acetyltransferase [Bacteroidales bacterium]